MNQTLTEAEIADLRVAAAMMIPASTRFAVPGADDPVIFADIVASIGRDMADLKRALAALVADGTRFAALDEAEREASAAAFRAAGGADLTVLSRVVLQCYYRDDRVLRAIGREPRPPFPKGHVLEQGDWSLLDPVRAMPKLWRDAG